MAPSDGSLNFGKRRTPAQNVRAREQAVPPNQPPKVPVLPESRDPNPFAKFVTASEVPAELPGAIPKPLPSAYSMRKLLSAARELAKRMIESLKIYEPLPRAAEFHENCSPEILAVGSNRSAKTLTCAIEFARAVTGQDPFNKYPKENGRAFIVAKTGKEVTEVVFRKLFKAGAFWIIRDEETGLWRVYRPWTDGHRKAERKSAPPLIPARFIQGGWSGIAWHNKKEGSPSKVTLKNGWEIVFNTSEGIPPQGVDIDIVWFDEEILNNEWYPEMSARLLDREGRLLWSATPQIGTQEFYDLLEEADEQRESGIENPRISRFDFLLADNPYISDEQKRIFAAKLSEEEREVRIHGRPAILGFRVYPEFDVRIHGIDTFDIPRNWTRYMITDPGRQVCAVLFAAIPPEEDEYAKLGEVFIYDELYLRNCDANKYGDSVLRKADGMQFYKFLIDGHMGKVAEMGTGLTVEYQYGEALRKRGIRSTLTGHGYQWGQDDVNAGIEAVRHLLRINEKGVPRLRVLREKCPALEDEFRKYSYKREKDFVTDKPVKRNDHLLDDLRYLALDKPEYHEQPRPQSPETWALRALREKKEKHRGMGGRSYVGLGPRNRSSGGSLAGVR